MENFKISDGGLAYYDRGEGEVVLLLHGFCGSSAYWDELVPLLDSHRVITVDLTGHGKSRFQQGLLSIEAMANDIYQLSQELTLPPFHLFGHSLGGYITLAYAEMYEKSLKSFGLIHSTAFPDSEDAKEKRLGDIQNIELNGMVPFTNSLVQKLFSNESNPHFNEWKRKAIEIGLMTHSEAAQAMLIAMRERIDRRMTIVHAKVPVLLVAGEKDRIIPVDKVYTSNHPHVKRVLLKESGHMGMVEEADLLAFELKKFMMRRD
ncbi:alpha/beta hydrolase [Bacillus spongiae]|uniref:Alpha/beta hydrolase n=1 Tax=Bacillus spongiae TaxID=2683610 RepID=A0ABU8HDV4_9BACI